MPSSETLELSGVPVLLHSPANRDRPAPLILLWHGFGIPNSEAALADAFPLEQVDAWKAYLGLPLFGQRFPGTEEIMRRQNELQLYYQQANCPERLSIKIFWLPT